MPFRFAILAALLLAPTPVYRSTGIVVRPPTGWFVSTEPLSGVTDPVERVVVSSYRLPVGIDAGDGYAPSARGVLAQLLEEVPPIHNPGPWPLRPPRFRLPGLGRIETLDGDRWGEIRFRERGRHFYIFIWVGKHATSAQVRQLLSVLDAIRIKTA